MQYTIIILYYNINMKPAIPEQDKVEIGENNINMNSMV